MKSRFLTGAAGVALAALVAGAAQAQTLPPLPPGVTLPGGQVTTITLGDGTVVKTTVNGPTSMTIELTGGPNPPITANITNLVTSGSNINYSGTVTVAGSTTAFDCTINTQTNSISGSQYCDSVFGGSSGGNSGGGGTVNPPTTGGGTTTPPPTTGGGTVTPTPGANGALYTMTLPGGGSIQVTQGEVNLIRNVEAEQFLLSLAAERLTVNNVQQFVASRLQAMQAAGLAPGGITIGSAGYRGQAAGEAGVRPGVWADVSFTDLEDERIGAGVEGESKSIAIGGDIGADNYNLGAFVSYGKTDLSGPDAINDADGFTYGLYGRWSPVPALSLNLVVGTSDQDVHFEREAGALNSVGDTDRSTTFAILSASTQLALSETFLLVPGASVSYAETETDAYIDSNGFPIGGFSSDTTVGTAGATLYYTGGGVVPFLSLNASRQFNDVAGVDRSWGTVGAGVIAEVAQGVNILAGVSTLVSKDFEKETSFSVTLRKGF